MRRDGVEPPEPEGGCATDTGARPCPADAWSIFHPAPPVGFEPTASTLTGWRALRAAPRGRVDPSGSGGIRTLSISRSGREWSAGCLPSQACFEPRRRDCPGWDSNPQAPGFKPGRSAGWRTRTGHSDRSFASSGGWNRTSGLRVQSAASLPAATAPDHRRFVGFDTSGHHQVRGGGFEPPSPGPRPGGLPLADPRVRPARVEPARPVRNAGASADRPGTRGVEAEGEGVEPPRLNARPFSKRLPSPIGLPFRRVARGQHRGQESSLRDPP